MLPPKFKGLKLVQNSSHYTRGCTVYVKVQQQITDARRPRCVKASRWVWPGPKSCCPHFFFGIGTSWTPMQVEKNGNHAVEKNGNHAVEEKSCVFLHCRSVHEQLQWTNVQNTNWKPKNHYKLYVRGYKSITEDHFVHDLKKITEKQTMLSGFTANTGILFAQSGMPGFPWISQAISYLKYSPWFVVFVCVSQWMQIYWGFVCKYFLYLVFTHTQLFCYCTCTQIQCQNVVSVHGGSRSKHAAVHLYSLPFSELFLCVWWCNHGCMGCWKPPTFCTRAELFARLLYHCPCG